MAINEQQSVEGRVTYFDCSGIGPNSGEFTLIIQPESGVDVVEVFGGIMDDQHHDTGLEHGVFASFTSIALAALTTGRMVTVTYTNHDKFRVHAMVLRA